MKKVIVFCALFFVFCITGTQAQGLFDKLDKLTDKVDRASRKVDNAGNTADRAGKTGGKLMSLFGKSKGTAKTDAKLVKSTISIGNISYNELKKLNTQIQEIEGVESTEMKFNSSTATINVKHIGTTADLLSILQERSKIVFSDKNLKEIEEGSIKVSL